RISLQDRANRDALARSTQLKGDVGHAPIAQDLLGSELDLCPGAFGHGDVADGSEEAEPFAPGDCFIAGEYLGVAAEDLGRGEGWDQGSKGQGDAEGSHDWLKGGLS